MQLRAQQRDRDGDRRRSAHIDSAARRYHDGGGHKACSTLVNRHRAALVGKGQVERLNDGADLHRSDHIAQDEASCHAGEDSHVQEVTKAVTQRTGVQPVVTAQQDSLR